MSNCTWTYDEYGSNDGAIITTDKAIYYYPRTFGVVLDLRQKTYTVLRSGMAPLVLDYEQFKDASNQSFLDVGALLASLGTP